MEVSSNSWLSWRTPCLGLATALDDVSDESCPLFSWTLQHCLLYSVYKQAGWVILSINAQAGSGKHMPCCLQENTWKQSAVWSVQMRSWLVCQKRLTVWSWRWTGLEYMTTPTLQVLNPTPRLSLLEPPNQFKQAHPKQRPWLLSSSDPDLTSTCLLQSHTDCMSAGHCVETQIVCWSNMLKLQFVVAWTFSCWQCCQRFTVVSACVACE